MRTDGDVLRRKHVGSGRRELRLQVARPREEQNKTKQAKAKAVPAPLLPLFEPSRRPVELVPPGPTEGLTNTPMNSSTAVGLFRSQHSLLRQWRACTQHSEALARISSASSWPWLCTGCQGAFHIVKHEGPHRFARHFFPLRMHGVQSHSNCH